MNKSPDVYDDSFDFEESRPRPWCEEMNHNSVGHEVVCTLPPDHPAEEDHDDGNGTTWPVERDNEPPKQAAAGPTDKQVEDAAAFLDRAAETTRNMADLARYHGDRWAVDVEVLKGSCPLGPAFDAVTATWRQARWVKTMSPKFGKHLAELFAQGAEEARQVGADPYLVRLAADVLDETPPAPYDRPWPTPAPEEPAQEPQETAQSPQEPQSDPQLPDATAVLRAGLRWLFDTVQPEGAVISPMGLSVRASNNRTYRFVVCGHQNRPVVATVVTRKEYDKPPGDPTRKLTNGLAAGELDSMATAIRILGYEVSHTWGGAMGGEYGSVALAASVHPTLWAAYDRYGAACPDHPEVGVFCECGWRTRFPVVPITVEENK